MAMECCPRFAGALRRARSEAVRLRPSTQPRRAKSLTEQRSGVVTDSGLFGVERKSGMKLIPRNIHGILDYLVGALLIAAPWLLGFADHTAATYSPVALGVGAILYSLLTDYELGLVRIIPFPMHLGLDAASGLLLAASPWLFGFADRVSTPHVVLGIFEVLAAVMTRNSSTSMSHFSHPATPHHKL